MRSAEDIYRICDELMLKKGITRSDLCRKIGINPANYTMGVKRKSYFNVDVLFAISEELDISLDELMGTKFKMADDYPADVKAIINKLQFLNERDLGIIDTLVTYLHERNKEGV